MFSTRRKQNTDLMCLGEVSVLRLLEVILRLSSRRGVVTLVI